ncbi:ABC transporter permease subunit [Sinorhizobium meliloti]|uniref:ABC transporter permease n=1 Tax=Rhizobium meliloti TaxID=382 RepID=UPI001294E5BF|nr:ABC transporter permease [Sinorhizobium meliloti]MQX44171.1 ABC transporter permease subunit [Sinorhizobium meliloti]
MLIYVIKRLLAGIPTLLISFTLVFFIAHATPGSPWDASSNRPIEPAVKARLDEKYNLNAPLYVQYVSYLSGAVRGDFGPSFRDRTMNVSDIVAQFLPVSLKLGGAAMLLAVLLGLPLGALAALSRKPIVDGAVRVISTVGISMPTYVVTSILIVSLGVGLGWVPTFGWEGFFSISSIVPIVSLALAPLGAVIRSFRTSLLEVMNLDFIKTARAKGLKPMSIIIHHMSRNALVPTVTVVGGYASSILVGSFFVESIAGIPGFGRYLVLAVAARDYPVIIATTLIYAMLVIVINILVDLSYFLLDPRVRLERS